jgi:hypothetical protein
VNLIPKQVWPASPAKLNEDGEVVWEGPVPASFDGSREVPGLVVEEISWEEFQLYRKPEDRV